MTTFASLEFKLPTGPRATAAATARARLNQAAELNAFLAGVERRACRIAELAVRNRDDALDIVQSAMMKLAQGYAERSSSEWAPIFHRILVNAIRDQQRRRAVRGRIFALLPGQWGDEHDPVEDPIEQVADGAPQPPARVAAGEAMDRLEVALAKLPARQREAFLLRCLEGLDVEATAAAMGCSAGSVKTHYFRALATLREQLGEVW